MEKNMGSLDRTVRIVAGLAIVAVGAYYGSWWGAIGLVLIVTGLMRVCPAYMPFKINTCGRGEKTS
jgi:hypothetical protein